MDQSDTLITEAIRTELQAPADVLINLIDPPAPTDPGGFIAKDPGRTVTGFWYMDDEDAGIRVVVVADSDSA